MRYGIPWYRVNPAPGRFDWSWMDQVLEHMVERLGIAPIIDLVHYGCPLWMEREFLHPDYPQLVTEYAAAFAQRYERLVQAYTPLNEPLVNIRFSGYTGYWPPYRRGWRGWVALLLPIAEGMSRTIAVLRELQPQARIVHVEATASYTTDDPALEDLLCFTRQRQLLPTDLLVGRVDETHALHRWLIEHAANEDALRWLADHPQEFDVMGVNFYPGMSAHRLVAADGTARRAAYQGGGKELERVIRTYGGEYGRPLMITETSAIGSIARRASWMDESIATVRRLRAEGVPIVGYTWWPMFSLVTWMWRGGRKEVGSYLGHMGLWDLRDDGHGGLDRAPTVLVDRFRAYVADTLSSIGPLAPESSTAWERTR
jgi:beta-glucosidase/6-phospho-beta-glucosidase/beta-galactosidase